MAGQICRHWAVAPIGAMWLLMGHGVKASEGPTYPLETIAGSRLLADASINGHPVKALLDSAAEATLVSPRLAREIVLGAGHSVQGQGSGAASFGVEVVKGVTLAAFGLELRNQEVGVTDLDDISRRLLKRRIDAILGREIFDAARLEIDIARRQVRVLSEGLIPSGNRLELTTEHGVETLPVYVEGRGPAHATFDLGNGNEVLVSQDYAKQMGALSDGRPTIRAERGGLGGPVVRTLFTLRSLALAGFQLHDVAAAVDPNKSASDLNVGISVLRHFVITTDFKHHAIWLQPTE